MPLYQKMTTNRKKQLLDARAVQRPGRSSSSSHTISRLPRLLWGARESEIDYRNFDKSADGRDDSDEGISFRQEIEELGLIRNPKFQGLEARMLDLYPYSLLGSEHLIRSAASLASVMFRFPWEDGGRILWYRNGSRVLKFHRYKTQQEEMPKI